VDRIAQFIAAILPIRVLYWAVYRAVSDVTYGDSNPMDVTVHAILLGIGKYKPGPCVKKEDLDGPTYHAI